MNITSLALVNETHKINRVGAAQGLPIGSVLVPKQRPAICDWADRLYEFGVDAACQGVALQLASYANKHGGCFPSVATLAKRVGLAERQCRRHLKTLARKGLIETRRRGRGHTNTYRLHGYGWASDRPSATVQPTHDRSCMTGLDRSCTTGEGNQKKVVQPPPAKLAAPKEPPDLPEHLEAIDGGHGLECRRCSHSWPAVTGQAHICSTGSARPTTRTRKGRSTDSMSERINKERLARIRAERS